MDGTDESDTDRVVLIKGKFPDLQVENPNRNIDEQGSQRERKRTEKGVAYEMQKAVADESRVHARWRQAVTDFNFMRSL